MCLDVVDVSSMWWMCKDTFVCRVQPQGQRDSGDSTQSRDFGGKMAHGRTLQVFKGICVALIVVGALACLTRSVGAQTMVESSSETRFQLDFHVSDAALKAILPAGWTSNAAVQGPAKDANLRLVFIDRVTINSPDGKPAGKTGSNRLVYLVAPVKDPAGAAVQLVVGGLTEDPADAPGPFGVYLPATIHKMERSTSGGTGSSGAGPILCSEDWVFAAATGEHLEMHIKYQRGVGNRAPAADVKFYSAKDPNFYQISKQEQVLDILRNVTTAPPDRVKAFSIKVKGGSYAKLFDGSEKVLSWDKILWINRSVSLP
jgi:hypothetical protein